jgi:formate dehydrogenase subunit delta
MSLDNLIKMANQIGLFFESMPDRDQAVADLANHLRRSWESRMRRELLAKFDSGEAEQRLRPIVGEALRRHRDLLAPTS